MCFATSFGIEVEQFFPVPAKIIDRENDCVDGRDPTAIRRGTFGKLLVEFEKFGRSPV